MCTSSISLLINIFSLRPQDLDSGPGSTGVIMTPSKTTTKNKISRNVSFAELMLATELPPMP